MVGNQNMASTSTNVSTPAAALTEPVQPSVQPKAGNREHSYGQILKSSALIGGASVANIAFGIIRTKAMALLLGPGGVGLIGLYNSIADLAQSVAGMGINSSGVRQIAEAAGSGETERVARTATVLRRISLVLGILGALLLIVFSTPVSNLTFGSPQFAASISLLAVAVLLRLISAGQTALIQGLRRVSDLAKLNVLGALFGTVLSIALVFWLGEKGIVPSLIAVAGMATLTSWWYSRKVQVQSPTMTLSQVGQEATGLLKLGVAFMTSGLLTMGAAYVIRSMILRELGLDAAGFYQSAWALGGLYVGFILQAMGADFYPRLTAVCKDDPECNRLVNEQAQIGLLLAGPGMIATLALAPIVIALFYSSKFMGAVEILRWICLGMTLRVIAWPMGFIILAKGAQTIFFWTEVVAAVVHVGLGLLMVDYVGLTGAGIAFFGLYVFHGFLVYFIVRRLTGFRWSAANQQIGLITLGLAGLVFGSFFVLPGWVASTFGTVVAVLVGVYSLRTLLKLVPGDRIPGPLRKLIVRLGLMPRG